MSKPLSRVRVVVDIVVHAVAMSVVIHPLPCKGRHKSRPAEKGKTASLAATFTSHCDAPPPLAPPSGQRG